MDLSELQPLWHELRALGGPRLLRLAWAPAVEPALAAALLPQRAWLREGLCEPTEARIACLSPHPALPVEALRGQPLALALATDDGGWRHFPLLLAQVRLDAGDGGLAVVHLVARDALWPLQSRRRLRVFREASVPQVVQAVLQGWVADGLPCLAWHWQLDEARHPVRAGFIQHPDESDAQFVQRLLCAEGIAWCWRPQATGDDGLPRQELLLFDDGLALPEPPGGPLRWARRRGGAVMDDAVTRLAPRWRQVAAGATLRSWDHEAAQLAQQAGLPGTAAQTPGDTLAQAMAPEAVAPPHLGDDAEHLARLARLEAAHAQFRARQLDGAGGVRTLAPGTWQRIEPLPPGLDEDARELAIVRVEHVAQSNLPAPLRALLDDAATLPPWAQEEAGVGGVGGAGGGYANRFTAVPRRVPIVPQPRPAPAWLRPLTGVVVDAGSGELHCDALARSQVRLLGGEVGADTTAWVRHRTPWAGPQLGLHFPLRAGTEVDVDWLGPDRPVIAGCLANGRHGPPRFDHLPGLPANRALCGVVTRELGGTRQQQLRFDDTPGRLGLQLASDHAASQLNLGALSTPMHEGRARPRGEGAELCSEGAAALRGARGVLVSSHPGQLPAGHQLQREELAGLVQALQTALEQLGRLAEAHRTSGLDAAPLRRLAQHLHDWEQAGAPVVAVSAAAGAVVASQDGLLLGAQTTLDAVSVGHTQLTAGAQVRLRAAQGVSAFAHRGGVEAVAAQGDVAVQAHDGDIALTARRTIRLTAGDKVVIQAPRVEIVSDGAATAWGGGGVVAQARGAFVVQSASFAHCGPGDGVPAGVALPGSQARFDQQVVLTDALTGQVLAARRCRIRVEDGQVIEAVTDAQGRVPRFRTALPFARYSIELVDDDAPAPGARG